MLDSLYGLMGLPIVTLSRAAVSNFIEGPGQGGGCFRSFPPKRGLFDGHQSAASRRNALCARAGTAPSIAEVYEMAFLWYSSGQNPHPV
ncbi:MAG: hypothetical protein ACU841_01340 [Gammaproteobacteria bacterium]